MTNYNIKINNINVRLGTNIHGDYVSTWFYPIKKDIHTAYPAQHAEMETMVSIITVLFLCHNKTSGSARHIRKRVA